jgi:uncharacterized protein
MFFFQQLFAKLLCANAKMEIPQKSTTHLRNRFLNIFLYILIAYALVLVLVRTFESRLVFFPNYPGRLEGDWHPRSLPVEDVWLTSSDGTKLHAWWIPNQQAKFTFLAFHGNASNIANRAPVYEFITSLPANVLALEYRGYGHSEGSPTEAGVYRDAEAAYQYLVTTEHIGATSIVSFGQSLGTAVAADLAAHHEVGGVVLEAPFPSAARVAREVYWFLPGVSVLVRSHFNTRAKLQQIRAPILVVHCTDDPVIPFRLGQEVYNTARSPKDFLAINGSCHEESSLLAPTQYRSALKKFLSTIEQPATQP